MMRENVTRTQHQDGSYSVESWRENGAVECPRCGQTRPLIEDVEAWETETGRILGWGPGTAECCNLVMITVVISDGGATTSDTARPTPGQHRLPTPPLPANAARP